jgi:nucleotide-binding universal stress UspA family protein
MQNLLVPLGTSAHAESTLAYAVAFASHFKSTIYVIDAYPVHSSMATLSNVSARIEEDNLKQIRALVAKTPYKKNLIKLVSSERDLIGTIKNLDKTIGLDLIIVSPLNNEINEEVFLGRIAGSMIKRTQIPVLVAPLEKPFKVPERLLLAFKTGEVKAMSTLTPLIHIQDKFSALLKLILVKVPGFANRTHQLSDALMQRAEQLLYSENATVYQGVLEHFQANQPDLLVAFKRERGFFEKLWEPDLIYKKDFYCTVPLLVLKNKE